MTKDHEQFVEKSFWGLQFQRMSPWPSWQGLEQKAGAGAVVESLHLTHNHKTEKETEKETEIEFEIEIER